MAKTVSGISRVVWLSSFEYVGLIIILTCCDYCINGARNGNIPNNILRFACRCLDRLAKHDTNQYTMDRFVSIMKSV